MLLGETGCSVELVDIKQRELSFLHLSLTRIDRLTLFFKSQNDNGPIGEKWRPTESCEGEEKCHNTPKRIPSPNLRKLFSSVMRRCNISMETAGSGKQSKSAYCFLSLQNLPVSKHVQSSLYSFTVSAMCLYHGKNHHNYHIHPKGSHTS